MYSSRVTVSTLLLIADETCGRWLTVGGCSKTVFQVGLAPETLRRSNLEDLEAGDGVNLERALPVDGRNSGHFVQGHVDNVGTILSMEVDQDSLVVKVCDWWLIILVIQDEIFFSCLLGLVFKFCVGFYKEK